MNTSLYKGIPEFLAPFINFAVVAFLTRYINVSINVTINYLATFLHLQT